MASDIKLDGEAVLLEGNVGVGVAPGARLDVGDRMRVRQGPSGTAGAWLFQAGADRAFVGMAADQKVGFYTSGGAEWAFVVDGTNGHVGIGVQAGPALRKLHVEGSEVHSGGPAGGFSFADRSVKKFVEKPAAGERWVWYCSHGTATLWSGADKLTVTTKGELQVGGANGVRITATQIVATTGKTIPLHGPAGTPTTQIPEQIELIGEVVKLRELVRDLQEQVSALKAKKP